MMGLRKDQYPILGINLAMLVCFTIYYIIKSNWEFVIFVIVIVGVLALLIYTNRRVQYTKWSLWGLTLWAALHMFGGVIYIGGTRLYEIILIPLDDNVFRYDQFVHIIGFGVATYIMYEVLRPLLRKDIHRFAALSIIVVMAGLGVGAFNEIIEFGIAQASPDNKIGGYLNTSLDLYADLLGSMLALIFILLKDRKNGYLVVDNPLAPREGDKKGKGKKEEENEEENKEENEEEEED